MLPTFMAWKGIAGASIALSDGERVVWAEGFGYTDRSRSVKVTADTPFFVGSITKSFTALGVLRAASQGLLSLDDPLKKHLPWFTVNSRFGAAEVDRITIRHLLSHHSGLGTWAPLGNPFDDRYHTRTFEEVVRSTRDSWLKFPAGERFEYCNQGMDLAGYALQTATGRPFVRYMREEMFEPLGMTASTFQQKEVTLKASFAVPYQGDKAVPIKDGIVHPMLAAGGMLSSASDLAKFINFHLRGGKVNDRHLVGEGLLREMYVPQFTAKGLASGYGLCVYKAIEHDTVRFSHGGFGYGISTHYRWLPEQGMGVVVLTNQGTRHNAPAIASVAVELMLKAKLGALPRNRPLRVVDSPAVALDEAALRRFEGTYLLYDGILARFKFQQGQLFHLAGAEGLRLEAHGPTEFTSGSRRYDFVLDEGGRPRGVRITDPYYDPSNAENSVTYLPTNDIPADARGPNKHEWSEYTGRYVGTFIGEGSEVKVALKEGYLFLNGELKLKEHAPGIFLTADGEASVFSHDRLSVGNRPYVKKS